MWIKRTGFLKSISGFCYPLYSGILFWIYFQIQSGINIESLEGEIFEIILLSTFSGFISLPVIIITQYLAEKKNWIERKKFALISFIVSISFIGLFFFLANGIRIGEISHVISLSLVNVTACLIFHLLHYKYVAQQVAGGDGTR